MIEEKRALIETQLRDHLYALAERPRVIGKRGSDGAPLVPEYGELSPAYCARLIAARLKALAGAPDAAAQSRRGVIGDDVLARIDARIAVLDAKERGSLKTFETIERIPYFCSGCPHNTSTKVPEGSRALAGIGCHYMAQWMDRPPPTSHADGRRRHDLGRAGAVLGHASTCSRTSATAPTTTRDRLRSALRSRRARA